MLREILKIMLFSFFAIFFVIYGVVSMETLIKSQNIISMEIKKPKKVGLLRRNKYYIKAKNEACAKCRNGKQGCCSSNLYVDKDDFKIDFTNEKQVKVLIDLDIFVIHTAKTTGHSYVGISTGAMWIDQYTTTCIFWTKTGCRLAHDSRPHVCRTYVCSQIYKNVEYFNKREKNRTYNIKGSSKFVQMGWSEEEMQTVLNIINDEYYFPPKRTYKEVNALDWRHILAVLQGE